MVSKINRETKIQLEGSCSIMCKIASSGMQLEHFFFFPLGVTRLTKLEQVEYNGFENCVYASS